MARFLIEVPHEAELVACVRAIEVFHETGSHFLTNADWGCLDDVHKAWFILEAEDKEEAHAGRPRRVGPASPGLSVGCRVVAPTYLTGSLRR
jgi:hypothetical protein